MLFYDPGYYFAHPLEILMVWHGGMAFHGGMLGALARRRAVRAALPAPWLTRAAISPRLAAPIGIFLGRIANFIKPELWGRPTDVPWAMVFPGLGRPAAPPEPDL